MFNSLVERAVQCCKTIEDAHNKSVLAHKAVVDTEDFNEAIKDKLKDNFKKAMGGFGDTQSGEQKQKEDHSC